MKALEFYKQFLALLPPKPESEHKAEKNQIVISLRKVAETNIVALKEELFFEEEVKN